MLFPTDLQPAVWHERKRTGGFFFQSVRRTTLRKRGLSASSGKGGQSFKADRCRHLAVLQHLASQRLSRPPNMCGDLNNEGVPNQFGGGVGPTLYGSYGSTSQIKASTLKRLCRWEGRDNPGNVHYSAPPNITHTCHALLDYPLKQVCSTSSNKQPQLFYFEPPHATDLSQARMYNKQEGRALMARLGKT